MWPKPRSQRAEPMFIFCGLSLRWVVLVYFPFSIKSVSEFPVWQIYRLGLWTFISAPLALIPLMSNTHKDTQMHTVQALAHTYRYNQQCKGTGIMQDLAWDIFTLIQAGLHAQHHHHGGMKLNIWKYERLLLLDLTIHVNASPSSKSLKIKSSFTLVCLAFSRSHSIFEHESFKHQ